MATFSGLIKRSPRDADHPYTMVLNELVRDNEISPNCRLLIIRLLSNTDDWEIKASQIHTEFKDWWGRDKVWSLMKEAMEAGYVERVIERKSDGYKMVSTHCIYYVSEKKLKNKIRHTENQCTEFKCTEETGIEEGTSLKNKQKKKNISDDHQRAQEHDDASGGDDDACGAKEISSKAVDLAADSQEIEVTKTNGEKLVMTQSAIYRYFIKKPYNVDIVREAIRRLREQTGPVNNILKYLESICQTIKNEMQRTNTKSLKKTKKEKTPYIEKPRVKEDYAPSNLLRDFYNSTRGEKK